MSRSQRAKKFIRFDSLGLVDFAMGLVDFFLGGGGGRTGEGRMEERMEKGPTFHFVKRAMRKSIIFFVSDMKILSV